MGLTGHVALSSFQVDLSPSDLTEVAAALSKQVARDFGPIWDINATVDAFADPDRIPTDYWPILVVPKERVHGAGGFHLDKDQQPFALVAFGGDWAIAASHECMEMLVDPAGSRMRAANLLQQALDAGSPDARVSYLVEVCDPSESGRFGYQINGVH